MWLAEVLTRLRVGMMKEAVYSRQHTTGFPVD